MKKQLLSTLATTAIVSMMSTGVAKANPDKKKEKAGWCKSNSCAGKVTGAKNSCNGKAACKGINKEACEKEGAGTWSTDKKPAE